MSAAVDALVAAAQAAVNAEAAAKAKIGELQSALDTANQTIAELQAAAGTPEDTAAVQAAADALTASNADLGSVTQ